MNCEQFVVFRPQMTNNKTKNDKRMEQWEKADEQIGKFVTGANNILFRPQKSNEFVR